MMNFIKYNGEGKCKQKKQLRDQLVDVAGWRENEEIEPYQEGARQKSRINCPEIPPFPFLIPNHTYLFKQSNSRYCAQFWVEIIAYRLGCLMNVPVPPAFIGIDNQRQIGGAIIEWFYNYPGNPREEYIPGGDLFQKQVPNYERKKGEKHNFSDLIEIIKQRNLAQNWQEEWAKIFCFDALIGNTDRHQDNWGIMHYEDRDYFSPAFDNGTAMGHEITEENLIKKCNALETYVLARRATHHIKWHRKDISKMKHFDFLKRLIVNYPDMKAYMRPCINFSLQSFADEMDELLKLSNTLSKPYAKLTNERAKFIIKLIECRQEQALEILS